VRQTHVAFDLAGTLTTWRTWSSELLSRWRPPSSAMPGPFCSFESRSSSEHESSSTSANHSTWTDPRWSSVWKDSCVPDLWYAKASRSRATERSTCRPTRPWPTCRCCSRCWSGADGGRSRPPRGSCCGSSTSTAVRRWQRRW